MPHPEPTPEYGIYIAERLLLMSNKWNSTNITDEERNEIEIELKNIEEYLWLIEDEAIKDRVRRNPENYLSTPWDPWEGFLDTMYLSGCYMYEFLHFVVTAIEEFLKKSSEKSKELLDAESNFNHRFSFGSIFSKDNDEPTEVPYTGEYQCSPKMN